MVVPKPEAGDPLQVRLAQAGDAQALMDLRNHYVATSSATFDELPMTIDSTVAWMARFEDRGPYRLLVAVQANRLLGFASSQRYRDHPAFDKTVETSVYVNAGVAAKGVGSALYSALFEHLGQQTLHRAVVGIALPNEASVALHRKFRFTTVGVFDEYACKNGRYISSVWMQRPLQRDDDEAGQGMRMRAPALTRPGR
jgi:phosphinothricin acetyltransferase